MKISNGYQFSVNNDITNDTLRKNSENGPLKPKLKQKKTKFLE